MRAQEFIAEALKPSQYRKYVSGWDKTRWADIFDNQYRIYIPLGLNSEPDARVIAALTSGGYTVLDYASGLAARVDDPRQRPLKIGGILSDTRSQIPPSIKQAFDNDPSRRSARSDNIIVISRHPYDIAAMSTDRTWTSCMNLDDGSQTSYIDADIYQGTIVAYLIRQSDRNIQKPLARLLIKPFINVDPLRRFGGEKSIALGVEDRVYGNAPPIFAETVVQWANKINDSRALTGLFQIHPDLYNDAADEIDDDNENDRPRRLEINMDGAELFDLWIHGEIRFHDISLKSQSQSEQFFLSWIKHNDEAIRQIPERLRTPEFYLQAIGARPSSFRFIPYELRTPELCWRAVELNWEYLKYVPVQLRTPEMCEMAVKKVGHALQWVPPELRTEQLCMAAVKQNNLALQYVPRPLQPIIKQKLNIV